MRVAGRLLGATLWVLGVVAFAPCAANALSDIETVNTTADGGLADNPNYCSGEGEGGSICPLRAALESARAITVFNGEGVIVMVPEGHYLLNSVKGQLPLGNATTGSCAEGATKFKCPVTLQGAGAGRTVIDGQGATGLLAVPYEAGPVAVAGVTLTAGSAEFGGAISGVPLQGGLEVRDSVLSANHANMEGGAIYSAGASAVTVTGSAITSNSAGIGGGIYAHKGAVILRRTTVSGNTAVEGGGLGVAQNSGAGNGTTLVDSTIAGNSATTNGGGISSNGADLVVEYSTIAGNTAAVGGGLYGGSVTLEGAILAGDTPSECAVAPAVNAVSANILYGVSTCSLSGVAPLGVDPKLGVLSANGGLGQTMPLLRGSPALNAGGSPCSGADAGSGPVDERLLVRPRGLACDLGAFESAADAAVSMSAAPDPVVVGGTLTLTATATNAGADPLTGVVLTVPVPSGASFVSAPSGCTAAFSATATVTCGLGSLAPGALRAVSITVRPERTGALLESASVVADQADYNPANDSTTIASVVAATPSIQGQAGGPGGGAAVPSSGAPSSALVGRVFTVDVHGNVTLRVSCSANAGGGCQDGIALYSTGGTLPAAAASRKPAKAGLLAHVHVTIPAGKTTIVYLRLDAAGRKLAKVHRSFSSRLLLSFYASAGSVSSHSCRVSINRAIAKHRR